MKLNCEWENNVGLVERVMSLRLVVVADYSELTSRPDKNGKSPPHLSSGRVKTNFILTVSNHIRDGLLEFFSFSIFKSFFIHSPITGVSLGSDDLALLL